MSILGAAVLVTVVSSCYVRSTPVQSERWLHSLIAQVDHHCLSRIVIGGTPGEQDFAEAGADMFTFHLEAVAPELNTVHHQAVSDLCRQVQPGWNVVCSLRPHSALSTALAPLWGSWIKWNS